MKTPLPVFDSLEYIANHFTFTVDSLHEADYLKAFEFLKNYIGSQGTFNAYRREVERLLHWCTHISCKTLGELKRQDIEEFILFCQKPPQAWIGIHKVPRFVDQDGQRVANPQWRPFTVTVSKAAHRKGERPDPKHFALSQSAIKDMFAILGSFYNYLLQEEYVNINPVALIRQKSKFIRKFQGQPRIRRLSDRQWQYVIETAQHMATSQPQSHERTLFIMSALYALYLRISELAASKRWEPLMSHFYRDGEENWWFVTVGKGNKQRQIAVSDAMLAALKRWRQHLGLTALPSPADVLPLLPKTRGQGPISNTSYIRKIVQGCFDKAIVNLTHDGFEEEADALNQATVHWLRHTGISDDVKRRPREHVRDDAGHGSGAITDKYIDIQLRERHKSAKHKRIQEA
jgi:site-specific recombinase XerD